MASVLIVSCPAPSLEEEGSGDTRSISVADWNAISAEWAGFNGLGLYHAIGRMT